MQIEYACNEQAHSVLVALFSLFSTTSATSSYFVFYLLSIYILFDVARYIHLLLSFYIFLKSISLLT